AHGYMAAIYTPNGAVPLLFLLDPQTGQPLRDPTNTPLPNTALQQSQRAKAIAWYDYIKSEMPDVFFVQNTSTHYPLNFAGNAYPGTTAFSPIHSYILPLGNSILSDPQPFGNSYGDCHPKILSPQTNPNLGLEGSGVFGASYAAAAGLY